MAFVRDMLPLMALLAIAGLLANYVLFAGSAEEVQSPADQSGENTRAPVPPPSQG
jgi:hypothetical protein